MPGYNWLQMRGALIDIIREPDGENILGMIQEVIPMSPEDVRLKIAIPNTGVDIELLKTYITQIIHPTIIKEKVRTKTLVIGTLPNLEYKQTDTEIKTSDKKKAGYKTGKFTDFFTGSVRTLSTRKIDDHVTLLEAPRRSDAVKVDLWCRQPGNLKPKQGQTCPDPERGYEKSGGCRYCHANPNWFSRVRSKRDTKRKRSDPYESGYRTP